jgi:hypothetical protein
MKAASVVWCRLPKNAAAAGPASRMGSLRVLIISSDIAAPTPSPRMNDAFLPMRSETRPAGTAVRARATKPISRRIPIKRTSNPRASR